MKKTILTIVLLLSALLLRADSRSQEILRKMAAAFNGYGSYKIEFTATMAGEFIDLPGVLIVSGEKYYLDVSDSKVFFDGRNGYTYSESNREVIIETPDPDDNRLFANPAKIFQVYEQDFTSVYKGTTIIGGKHLSEIELTPKSSDAGYNKVTLYADPAGAPGRLVYHLSEYGKSMVLNVVRITPNPPVTNNTFRFDPARHPGVEVIDFR